MDVIHTKNEIIKGINKEISSINQRIVTASLLKNKAKAKFEMNKYKEDLYYLNRYINIIKKIFNGNFNNYIKKYSYLIGFIQNTDLNMMEQIDAICYLININYNFFTNENNLEKYCYDFSKNITQRAVDSFYTQQTIYTNLRSIITEDNTVGYLKETNGELYSDFEKIGVPKEIINIIIDMAMRNYENSEDIPKR